MELAVLFRRPDLAEQGAEKGQGDLVLGADLFLALSLALDADGEFFTLEEEEIRARVSPVFEKEKALGDAHLAVFRRVDIQPLEGAKPPPRRAVPSS